MSLSTGIGSPFTLASLPRPVPATGHTHASVVHSISGSKKRKRTEISTGVDGEGVLIYSLQNPRLVTSYALPPETSFLTSPYSLYQKGSSKQSNRRFTYAAVTISSHDETPKILSFREEIQRDGTSETTKASYNTTGRPVYVDSIYVAEDDHDVIYVSQDGQIECLAHDLERKRWGTDLRSICPGAPKDLEVEFVSSTTARTAIRGLLRNREDIAILLDPTGNQNPDVTELTTVLSVVCRRSDNQRVLSLFQIHPRAPDLITTHLSPVKHLWTWDLPAPLVELLPVTTQHPHYYLHSSTGILHQLSEDRVVSFDFSGTVPKIYSDVQTSTFGINTFLRISPDLLFTASTTDFGILDVKYNSIQARRSITLRENYQDVSKKRKVGDLEAIEVRRGTPSLISYFGDLNIAVALLDDKILGLPLDSSITHKRAKTEGSLLVNALGKGLGSKKETDDAHSPLSLKTIQKLARYASKDRLKDFESVLAGILGVELLHSNEPDDQSDTRLTNGTGHHTDPKAEEQKTTEKELPRWRTQSRLPTNPKQRELALITLGHIFKWTEPSAFSDKPNRSTLHITFFPPNAFQWLLSTGYVTKESIRRAIVEHSTDSPNTSPSIVDGDIVKAIIELDPELHVLSVVLDQRPFLPIGEIVQAVQMLILSLDEQPKVENEPRMLTNGTKSDDHEMDVDFASELDGATEDLDHALSLLNDGLDIRNSALRLALMRLYTFPADLVASTLRSMLPRQKLESLIRILHSELRNGGWTTSYQFVSADAQFISDDPENQAVTIIASLLSCALDAIGTNAWLSANATTMDSTEDMIHDLLSDTADALSGFWEGRFMTGLLNEFLRYAHRVPNTLKPTNERLQEQRKPITVDTAIDGALPMLPLGAKPDMGVDNKKGSRTARAMGVLISKKVPKYSLERIVL